MRGGDESMNPEVVMENDQEEHAEPTGVRFHFPVGELGEAHLENGRFLEPDEPEPTVGEDSAVLVIHPETGEIIK